MAGQVWDALARELGAIPPEQVRPPGTGRVGGALALLREVDGSDLEIVYTRRRDDLRSHPGQVSFPGGRVDPGETVEQAALREAHEEVDLDPSTVTVLGRLPTFFIPPSRFWLQVVVARWDRPHPLRASEAEVADVLHVRVSHLTDPANWRRVRLSQGPWSWAWALREGFVLWGATAFTTAALLELLDPRWSGGVGAEGLDADREVRPWEGDTRTGRLRTPSAGPALLPGVPSVRLDPSATATPPLIGIVADPTRPPGPQAAAAVADAVMTLLSQRGGTRTLVLAGSGRSGKVGIDVAERLAAVGPTDVVAVELPADATVARLRRAGASVRVFDGPLAPSDVVVDALVGRGLVGPLRDPARAVVMALRRYTPVVVAVDVPTGLDAEDGIAGDLVAADVTVALGSVAPGLLAPGMGPFVGDLYVAGLPNAEPFVRVVPGAPSDRWRE